MMAGELESREEYGLEELGLTPSDADATGGAPGTAGDWKSDPAATAALNRAQYVRLHRETRNWGLALLALGVLHLLLTGFLNASWGMLLIIVGLSSFYFRSAAIFVVYSGALAWAAVTNVLSGSGSWMIFALIQVVFTVQTFRKFLEFRKIETELGEAAGQEGAAVVKDRCTGSFPWISLALGLASIIGMAAIFVGAIVYYGSASPESLLPAVFVFLEGMVINAAIIGLTTGVASLLMGYRYKVVSILGAAGGAIILLAEIVLGFLQ